MKVRVAKTFQLDTLSPNNYIMHDSMIVKFNSIASFAIYTPVTTVVHARLCSTADMVQKVGNDRPQYMIAKKDIKTSKSV